MQCLASASLYPVVELSKIVAEANASVTVIGELVRDLTNPVVRVYADWKMEDLILLIGITVLYL